MKPVSTPRAGAALYYAEFAPVVPGYGTLVIGTGATAGIQARSRNDICSMFEVPLDATSGGHTWFRPFCFAA
jgi:hypothetical protein